MRLHFGARHPAREKLCGKTSFMQRERYSPNPILVEIAAYNESTPHCLATSPPCAL